MRNNVSQNSNKTKTISLPLQGSGAHGAFTWDRIDAEDVMKSLRAGSKLDISWPFLTRLKNLGRERTGQWLDENFDHIGHASTLDLQAWEPAYH